MGVEIFDRITGRPVIVNMDETHAQALVNAVVDAVRRETQGEALEHFRQFARLEADLARAREENARKDQEIDALRSYADQLRGVISTMAPAANQFSNHVLGGMPAPVYVPTPPAPPSYLPPVPTNVLPYDSIPAAPSAPPAN